MPLVGARRDALAAESAELVAHDVKVSVGQGFIDAGARPHLFHQRVTRLDGVAVFQKPRHRRVRPQPLHGIFQAQFAGAEYFVLAHRDAAGKLLQVLANTNADQQIFSRSVRQMRMLGCAARAARATVSGHALAPAGDGKDGLGRGGDPGQPMQGSLVAVRLLRIQLPVDHDAAACGLRGGGNVSAHGGRHAVEVFKNFHDGLRVVWMA